MQNTDYEILCDLFYNSCDIPIRFYSEHKILLIQYPLIEEEMDAFSGKIDEFYGMESTVSFRIDEHSLYFGCVKDISSGCYILIGPATDEPCSDSEIRTIMAESFVPSKYYDTIIRHLSIIPCMEIKRFISTLSFLHYQINGTSISGEDIYPDIDLESNGSKEFRKRLAKESYYKRNEKDLTYTNMYADEKKYLYLIGTGNEEAISHLISSGALPIPGIRTDASARLNKDAFILHIGLASRCAIQNGLEIDTALQLCESYIKLIESAQDMDAMYKITYDSFRDLARRVLKSKIPENISPMINKCIQYIGSSVNMPITVSDVAEFAGKSKVYVSTRFKSELGMGLNEYITRRKIEESKNLLCFTDKTISEISFELSFSSQSYFQNVFKKITKLTPQKYRENSKMLI